MRLFVCVCVDLQARHHLRPPFPVYDFHRFLQKVGTLKLARLFLFIYLMRLMLGVHKFVTSMKPGLEILLRDNWCHKLRKKKNKITEYGARRWNVDLSKNRTTGAS